MKRIIWRPVDMQGVTDLDIPEGAKVLSCVFEGGALGIFLEVDPSAKYVKRSFRTITTGWDVSAGAWRYAGSVQQLGTGWETNVYHIYELPEQAVGGPSRPELLKKVRESRRTAACPKSTPQEIAKSAFNFGLWCGENQVSACELEAACATMDGENKKVSLNLKKRDLDGPYPVPR
jgi:hypothetical protein